MVANPPPVEDQAVAALVRKHLPDAQAVYLFGSCADGSARPDSDLDLAVLLPAGHAGLLPASLAMQPLHAELVALVGRDVDLLNLRLLPTVLQKEIVTGGRRIDCRDSFAADQFDVTILSRYQKLNQERAGIIDAFRRTGQAWHV